jgi:pantoate--beta-alanine ligase
VRETDGLALSSRNAYLSADERRRAVALPSARTEARDAINDGTPVDSALEQGRRRLQQAGFSPIDYFALVDASSLEPISRPHGTMRILAAATIGNTRLIDNVGV